MTPEQRSQYRAIGERLAVYIRNQTRELPGPATLQAVAADHAGSHGDLVLPLKDLVTRPSFRRLADKAGSGGGSLERQALLQAMQITFSPQVIEALGEVLSGFLDLPSDSNGSPTVAEIRREQTVEASDLPSIQNPDKSSGQRPIQEPPASQQGIAAKPHNRLPVLAGFAAITALLTSSAVILSRHPYLCGILGQCPTQQAKSATEGTLQDASKAEQDLRRAQKLSDYREATEQLQIELLKLTGDRLTEEQQKQHEHLQTTAKQAQSILREEEILIERLKRATQALDTARTASGEDRLSLMNVARKELDAMPTRSFSASEASRLRQRLIELEGQPSIPSGPETAPPEPSRANEAPSSKPPVAQPATRMPTPVRPVLQPQAPSAEKDTYPNRDQPLF